MASGFSVAVSLQTAEFQDTVLMLVAAPDLCELSWVKRVGAFVLRVAAGAGRGAFPTWHAAVLCRKNAR